ncbi:hypothetical protein G4Y79_03200 [Phototrophicus methaneseepsis]|uniref:Uncharacterized protein n=1 Tax=Phototrophicus methaneseepsis TaxID=2710758 RepID=A0A7S8EAI2_9CHLR|nr:hypothetical protein [Phototrophicus methaneseepsis]QPC83403.1 hypothetical protein G4Y79_03200 [Phototrophicus methaneseepsis]
MPFRFAWRDEDQTVMQLIVEGGDWNWRDYHHVARACTFSMLRLPHPVHMLIDLRGSTREKMPAGAAVHVRSFGKIQTPAMSGKAVVIGYPQPDLAELGLGPSQTLSTRDGTVYFVASEDEAEALFNQWRAEFAQGQEDA